MAVLDGIGPVGFVQSYSAVECHIDGRWLDEQDPGVRGIDRFLASPSLLDRGLGTKMIGAFVKMLLHDLAVTRVQTDPATHNHRAIRCYEKTGFRAWREIETPDGRALLMYLDR